MPEQIGNTEIFSTDEVATVIGKGRQTALNLINEGVIRGKKIGQTWVVTRENLLKYMAEINYSPDMIEYRLGLKSPKNGKPITNSPD